jgi:DNA-directed RNA polymerase specialized sigma24 family protein
VQETLLAAWRGLERFEGRASLRSWLYRIATNRCLNALRDRGRRPQELPTPPEETPPPPQPTRLGEAVWLEPYPDVLLEGIPVARTTRRPATRLARRSDSRSRPLSNGSHPANAPCSSCATCWHFAPPRLPRCSASPKSP